MALQPTIVHVVNRTTHALDVMDDGRPYVIPPGYVAVPDLDPETQVQRTKKEKDPKTGKPIEVPLLKVVGADKDGQPSLDGEPCEVAMLAGAAIRARRQHILRGSQDPVNPQFAETLVAIREIQDPETYQEQRGDEVELLDRSLLPADRQAVEVQKNPHHLSPERRRSLVDPRLTNIAGMRMDY